MKTHTLNDLIRRYPESTLPITTLMRVLRKYVPDRDVEDVLLAHVSTLVVAIESEGARQRDAARMKNTRASVRLAKCQPDATGQTHIK